MNFAWRLIIIIFFGIIFAFSAKAALFVSCSSSPNPANVNQTVLFSSQVTGGTGSYSYYWSGDCAGFGSTCSNSFYNPGIKTVNLTVNSGGQSNSTTCSVYINPAQGNRYLACYDNDVYWFDTILGRQEKYQECQDSYCQDIGPYYCSGNNVYVQQSCYTRGCSGAACYSSGPYNATKLVQACGYNQTCQSGHCQYLQYPEYPECILGPCCENGRIKPSTAICNTDVQTEYSCPWGAGCGIDVGKRTRSRVQYCSGTSPYCTGNWSDWSNWSNWAVADYCSGSEACISGYSSCQRLSFCLGRTGYIKYYRKACYNNALYWYDTLGIRQALYSSCEDNNSCTQDSCQNNKCVHTPNCESPACEKSSKDYCDTCLHVGDGICNCRETSYFAPADCGVQAGVTCPSSPSPGGVIIAILGKKGRETTQWSKDLFLLPKEDFDFLAIINNQGENNFSNPILKVALPKEINFSGDLKIDGASSGANIETGIVLGSLAPKTLKTVTFRAKTAAEGQAIVGATVVSDSLSATDYLKVNITKSGAQLAAIGNIFGNFLRNNYIIALFFIIAIIVLVLILRGAYFSLKKTA